MQELVYFFLISFLITISTIGYGLLIIKLAKYKFEETNLGLVGLLGLFCLSIIASYTHIVIAHDYIHNIIIIIFGLILLFFFSKKLKINLISNIKYLFLIFSTLFLCLIISKTNEDFPYYHLPNSLQFAEQKLQFGLGNLNHGFKHISSIFMLMSLNYLPYFEYYLFNLTNFIFLIFLIYFIIFEIYKKDKNNSNISRIFLCLILILFLAKFSRLAEYGSDIAAQIIISVYFYFILEILLNKNIKIETSERYLQLSVILIVFASTLKFIFVIYSIFLIMILFKLKKNFFNQILKFNFLVLIIPGILFYIFFNFSSTGCFLYPVKQTCLSNYFDWSLSFEIVDYMNLHYETWAKGGKGPNFNVNDPLNYISSFNWLSNWIDVYFINKVSDFILVSFLIVFIFGLFFLKEIFSSKIQIENLKNKTISFYFLIVITFFLWFLNFPTLRYAGYIIVFLLLTFPFIFIFSRTIDTKSKLFIKKISIIFLISYSIFLYKNISRLNYELNIPIDKNHNFTNFPYFWVDNVEYEKKLINGIQVYSTSGMCWNIPTACVRGIENINLKKINNYIFYYRNK